MMFPAWGQKASKSGGTGYKKRSFPAIFVMDLTNDLKIGQGMKMPWTRGRKEFG